MQFIDTHCHLDAAEFGTGQAALLETAQAAGVGRIVVPSVARASFEAVRELCGQFPGCAPAYGIHPMYTGAAMPGDLDALREYLAQPDTVAVGEIGLGGEIRTIGHVEKRIQEAAKLGFKRIVIPHNNLKGIKGQDGIDIVGVQSVNEAIQQLLG